MAHTVKNAGIAGNADIAENARGVSGSVAIEDLR
jgi:hypothetical protein